MLEKMSLLIRCRNYARILLLSLAFLIAADSGTGGVCAATANSLYSLAGAEYQLYTDSACTKKAKTADGSNAVLTTDENGDSEVLEMEPGTYYAKEIKASRGYRIDADANGDAKVYTIKVTADDTESDPASFISAEPPVYGVPDFTVLKTDPKGAFDYRKLLGAKFTVKYYDAATNTISMTKEVAVPAGTKEEDYAATLAEVEIPKFIEQFKKSTKPSDVTIKKEGIAKGATITVSFVNKATGEEIAQCEITPDDLK